MLAFRTSAAATAPPEPTLLHLSATGTVQATPDLLVAEMSGETSAPGAADAQRQLNRRMDAASRLAAAAKGVSWRLQGYESGRSNENPQGVPQGWTARQMLRLEAADGETLLNLVGRLQATGLAVARLSWTLSATHRAEAEAAASDLALKTLRRRADAAAASLQLKVGTIRDVTLESGNDVLPRPMIRTMIAGSTPDATESVQEVSQTVSAEIALHP